MQEVLGSIPGGDQLFLMLHCLKIPVKERINLNKYLSHNNVRTFKMYLCKQKTAE